jgi:hypothetical protein
MCTADSAENVEEEYAPTTLIVVSVRDSGVSQNGFNSQVAELPTFTEN